jgi:hypothetical protein
MEIVTPDLQRKSPLDETYYDETAAQLGLSPEYIETFLTKVNSQLEGEGLETFDGDMLLALIDLYATDNKYPERVEVMVGRLLSVLSDKIESESESTFYEDFMYVHSQMPKIMARRFEVARDSRVDPNEFSVSAVHSLRRTIDPDEKFFDGSLDSDEVNGLVDLYAQSRLNYATKPINPEILDRQLLKLASFFKGRRRIDIQKDFQGEGTNDMVNITTVLKRELAWLAMNPVESEEAVPEAVVIPLPQKQPEAPAVVFDREIVNKTVESFLEVSLLPKEHKESFKYHIGFTDKSLPGATTQQRNDACEKVREFIVNAKLRDRSKYNVTIDNLPTLAQLQVVGHLLGNRSAAVNPVSRTVLVNQYSIELRKRYQDTKVDETTLQQRINQYGDLIDQALAQTLDWATSPKYLYDSMKPNGESA